MMKQTFGVAIAALILALSFYPAAAAGPDNWCGSGANAICQCQGAGSCQEMDKYCGTAQQCRTVNGTKICQCDKALVKGGLPKIQRAPVQPRSQ